MVATCSKWMVPISSSMVVHVVAPEKVIKDADETSSIQCHRQLDHDRFLHNQGSDFSPAS